MNGANGLKKHKTRRIQGFQIFFGINAFLFLGEWLHKCILIFLFQYYFHFGSHFYFILLLLVFKIKMRFILVSTIILLIENNLYGKTECIHGTQDT